MVGIVHIAIGNLQCEQFYYKGLLAYRQFCFLSNFVDSCRSEKIRKNKKARFETDFFCTMMTMVNMGWEMGFEPTIFGTTIRRFNQLSYTHHVWRALLDSNQWLTA